VKNIDEKMIVLINESVDREKWQLLIHRSKYSSPFQTPEYRDFINSNGVYHSDVVAIELDGEYRALVVIVKYRESGFKAYFSTRGIINGGPMLLDGEESTLVTLLNAINKLYKRRLIYIEVRNSFDYSTYHEMYLNSGWSYTEHLNVQIDVSNASEESVLLGMKGNRKREIVNSLKEGVEIKVTDNPKEVKQLYVILRDLYDTRVKLPLPPLNYFLSLFESSIGKVIVVSHNNTIIGGTFCVCYSKLSINTLYYAGLRNYHKKIFPTHLAILGVIHFAIQNGVALVDMMGAGNPNKEYGVRKYKQQFGGDTVSHGRYKYVFKPLLYKVGELGVRLLTKGI
jgi:serine/alanine adding enzyme